MEYLGLFNTNYGIRYTFFAIYLSHKRKTQKNKIREMELQKEILELEIEKQDSKVKLLGEENKKLDNDLMLLGKQ